MYDRLKLGVVRLHGEEGGMRHDVQPVAMKSAGDGSGVEEVTLAVACSC